MVHYAIYLLPLQVVIEIEKHIINLLLRHDCVIVPGFGGFVAHHVSAVYDERSSLFYPPLRTLGFNPALKMNDSMLVQSFIDIFDVSYPEAQRMIEDDVETLRSAIQEHGFYEIYGLGTLRLNDAEGYYDFEPCEAGILTPSLYGLCSVAVMRHNEPKSEAKGAETSVVTTAIASQNDSEGEAEAAETPEEQTAKIWSMDTVYGVAVACVVAILLVFFPSTVNNGGDNAAETLADTSLLLRVMPKGATTQLPSFTLEKHLTESVDSVVAQDIITNVQQGGNERPAEAVDTAIAPPYYTIVLASKVSRCNAESFVSRLHSKGFSDVEMDSTGNHIKVLSGRYKDKEAAVAAMKVLKADAGVADAWLMKIAK